MQFYRLTYTYFALMPILSGTILIEFRLAQTSIITFVTLLFIGISVSLMLLSSSARVGKKLILLLGLCVALFLFKPIDLPSIFWLLLFLGGFATGKNLSTQQRPDLSYQFINVIKPMILLTATICILQLILQERFLDPRLDQRLHPDIFSAPWGYRISAFSSSPNALGYFLAFTIWTSYWYRSILFEKSLRFKCFFLLQIILLFLTLSRGAILALLVTFIFFAGAKLANRLILSLVFLSLIVIFLTWIEDDFLKRVFTDPRIFGFANAVSYLVVNPEIFVIGLGFSDEVLRMIAFSDNFILQIIIGGGIPALLLLLSLFRGNKRTKSSSDRTYLEGMAAIFLTSMLFTASPQFLYFFFPAITMYYTAYHR